MFTWNKGFCELEEKVKSQNKNGNKKMNQKDFSLFANKTRMMILNHHFIFSSKEKASAAAFLRCSLRKIFLNSLQN